MKVYTNALQVLRELIADKKQPFNVRQSAAHMALHEFGSGAIDHNTEIELAQEDARNNPNGTCKESVNANDGKILGPSQYPPLVSHEDNVSYTEVKPPISVKNTRIVPGKIAATAKGTEIPRQPGEIGRHDAMTDTIVPATPAERDEPERKTGKEFLAQYKATHPKKGKKR